MMIQSIETHYKGYQFRCLLEAQWAVFFDTLGVEWEYEKEGYNTKYVGGDLPGFWLPDEDDRKDGRFIEIKSRFPDMDELEKLFLLASEFNEKREVGRQFCLLYGSPGVPEIALGKENWSLTDGCLALITSGGVIDDTPVFTVGCPAMVGGGSVFDFWTLYVDGDRIRNKIAKKGHCKVGPLNVYHSGPTHMLFLFQGLSQGMYVGPGVDFTSRTLLDAYRAARSARFEHGEKGL